MSGFRYRMHAIPGLFLFILLLGTASSVTAGNFSEAFKNFVLGSEVNAGTLPAVQLPPTSQASTCMECHNGSAGPRINMKHAGTPMQFRGHMSIDHPVGMDYGQYAYKRPESYVLPARVDARILFEDGKVTCVSCHQTKTSAVKVAASGSQGTSSPQCNAAPGYTTGPNRTRLCLGCHSM